mmetsp:Transcript_24642/g.68713  ORF Transcript_24642/g.68713 Transcript_24642/m.68713 type:complete len:228 (-) Transcript_24642:22-705(-)
MQGASPIGQKLAWSHVRRWPHRGATPSGLTPSQWHVQMLRAPQRALALSGLTRRCCRRQRQRLSLRLPPRLPLRREVAPSGSLPTATGRTSPLQRGGACWMRWKSRAANDRRCPRRTRMTWPGPSSPTQMRRPHLRILPGLSTPAHVRRPYRRTMPGHSSPTQVRCPHRRMVPYHLRPRQTRRPHMRTLSGLSSPSRMRRPYRRTMPGQTSPTQVRHPHKRMVLYHL